MHMINIAQNNLCRLAYFVMSQIFRGVVLERFVIGNNSFFAHHFLQSPQTVSDSTVCLCKFHLV